MLGTLQCMGRVNQQEEERDVFLRFAELYGDDIDVQTVEKRDPPEPDIRCCVAGKPCAFELVELVDRDAARRQSRQIAMQGRLLDACDAMNSEDAAQLRQRAGNASVSLRFTDDASARARDQTVPRILELLRGIDSHFIGDVSPSAWWKGVIESIRITRPGIVGPGFSVASAGYLRTPMLSSIQAKFGKTYQSDAPVELLAYHHFRRPPIPEMFWHEPLSRFLHDQTAASLFRRVWIFDYLERRIDLVVPEL